MDLGVAWLRQQWAVVSARYSASSSTAPPPGLLHIHFPGFLVGACEGRTGGGWLVADGLAGLLDRQVQVGRPPHPCVCLPACLQVNGCVSAAAVVAAAATWLGRSVPGHVAIIGETDATGGVVGRLGDEGDAETVLRLAHFNGVRLVLVPASSESGRQVRQAQMASYVCGGSPAVCLCACGVFRWWPWLGGGPSYTRASRWWAWTPCWTRSISFSGAARESQRGVSANFLGRSEHSRQ